MKIRNILTVVLFLEAFSVQAQTHTDTVDYSLNARINPGFGKYTPFLSSVNQFDRYSLVPNCLSLWGSAHKRMNDSTLFDYGFGSELDANISTSENRFFPGELYVEGKAYFLKATMGMKRRIYGNQDPVLSSGGMIWSQNSRPIPGISVETNDYIDLPYTKGYVEVKGGITHGWFTDNTVTTNTLLHHKYAYVRVGGSFPVNINFGIQHVCQWAGTSPNYGYSRASWANFKRIFLGESGGASSPETEQFNALGNHIISKNLGVDLNLKSINVSLYWQNIYEDGPIKPMYKAFNVEDGLWGASVRLTKFKPLNRFVLEYMSTTDQSGPWHDLDGVIYGGLDNYYNNGVYSNGWTFYGMTIGNPWLTSPKYNEDGTVSVTNNKVRLYYLAGMGSIKDVSYKATFAYSKNWGSPSVVYDKCKRQFSYQLETSTPLHSVRNINLTLGISGDRGAMYGNNFALLLGISYFGNFFY
jgi:hypothetical protein